MIRIAAFVIAVLLLGGWVAPHEGILIALTVLTGLGIFTRFTVDKSR